MAGVNKVILLGHLGRDPEMRYMSNGDAIASFSLATSSVYKDKNGNKQENTEWHNVSAFGRTAEVVGQYCKKGSQLYLEGRLKTDKYTDKEGNPKYATKVIVDRIQLIGGKSDNNEDQNQNSRNNQSNNRSNAPVDNAGSFDEDDIPF